MPEQLTSDDHSVLEPPLPIPNRAVKRDSADDSVDYPCESRSSSDFYTKKPRGENLGAFYFLNTQFKHTQTGKAPQQPGLPRLRLLHGERGAGCAAASKEPADHFAGQHQSK